MKNDIEIAFETYCDVVFNLDAKLSFWKSFLNTSIEEFRKGKPNQMELFGAIFTAYDIDQIMNLGYLKTYMKKNVSITASELDKYIDEFFTWVMNLAILKIYNAVELFLLTSIQLNKFPELGNSIKCKKDSDNINSKIKSYLTDLNIKVNTKNNKHIIEFLKTNENIDLFLKQPIRIDLKSTWGSFFEMASILRNIIAHQGTIISKDAYNEIKQNANDLFHRYFKLNKDEFDNMHLSPIISQFMNFINYYNDFVVNVVKFLFNEKDLKFLKMY